MGACRASIALITLSAQSSALCNPHRFVSISSTGQQLERNTSPETKNIANITKPVPRPKENLRSNWTLWHHLEEIVAIPPSGIIILMFRGEDNHAKDAYHIKHHPMSTSSHCHVSKPKLVHNREEQPPIHPRVTLPGDLNIPDHDTHRHSMKRPSPQNQTKQDQGNNKV